MSSDENDFVEDCAIAWLEKHHKKRGLGSLCAYPSCVEVAEEQNRFTDLVWCSAHRPNPSEPESDGMIEHNLADMVPDSSVSSLVRCTNFTKKHLTSNQLQMLFTCRACGKVCAFCAKQCHHDNHSVIRAEYAVGSCQRVEIQAIETHYVALVRGANGKRRKIHEVVSYKE